MALPFSTFPSKLSSPLDPSPRPAPSCLSIVSGRHKFTFTFALTVQKSHRVQKLSQVGPAQAEGSFSPRLPPCGVGPRGRPLSTDVFVGPSRQPTQLPPSRPSEAPRSSLPASNVKRSGFSLPAHVPRTVLALLRPWCSSAPGFLLQSAPSQLSPSHLSPSSQL